MYHNFIGIDIGKDTFVTAGYGSNSVHTFPNTSKGYKAFCKVYRGTLKNCLVVLETTGGYEISVLRYLIERGITAHRANTRKVKYFIKSLGKQGKSDAIDAEGLANYAAERHARLEPFAFKDTLAQQLQNLVQRRIDLKEMLVQEKNRKQAPNQDALVIKSIEYVEKILENESHALDEKIQAMIKSAPEQAAKQEVLITVSGIGEKISASLIALVPELGKLNRRQIASLIGLAPHPYESGKTIGYRRTKGGRRDVRSILFMAAMAASRGKDRLGEFYRDLVARGKKKMVAMTALMRKILVIANARMAEHYQSQAM